ARRTAGHVDVHGYEAVDALHHGIGVEDATGRGARAHADAPLGLGHLQPDPLEDRQHLHHDPAGDDHQVALPRGKTHGFGAEAGDVVLAGAGGHQFDAAAGGGEGHGPETVGPDPVGQLVQVADVDVFGNV